MLTHAFLKNKIPLSQFNCFKGRLTCQRVFSTLKIKKMKTVPLFIVRFFKYTFANVGKPFGKFFVNRRIGIKSKRREVNEEVAAE